MNSPAPNIPGAVSAMSPFTEYMNELELEATSGAPVNPARIIGPAVIFCYPFTGRPGYPNPPNWDHIKGAHGSTPQAQPARGKAAGCKPL